MVASLPKIAMSEEEVLGREGFQQFGVRDVEF